MKKAQQQILAKIFIDVKTGCWNWRKKPRNYPTIGYKGKTVRANRLSYMAWKGPIPKGMWVLHECDNKRCANPDHLFLGTPKANTLDSVKKGRWPSKAGTENGRAKLTPALVLKIRASSEMGTILARRFRVTPTVVCQVRKRRTWAHI